MPDTRVALWPRLVFWTGLILSILTPVVLVVLFLQPWVSCAEDDSSAGCPVGPVQAAVQLGVAALLPISIAMVAVGALARQRRGR
ncbi:hypothetical protein [Cellulomonas bogoriensis]|uniref:Uncharacterized protein n=1 Tax=Cellulomonas bogoriensis 69B4 = DSM 16987 TaxID=1386082 RepID=A0A0A0BLQ2_9CELL|nr:hypothetical protein [Cellulomonas bogoriensis]KGM08765.1 hypothetical protein N869_09745 [Cellulomonas bogoriensis 69B4 = DSM 16987]